MSYGPTIHVHVYHVDIQVRVHVFLEWVNGVGSFFLKIPVWLVCYAHGFMDMYISM